MDTRINLVLGWVITVYVFTYNNKKKTNLNLSKGKCQEDIQSRSAENEVQYSYKWAGFCL